MVYFDSLTSSTIGITSSRRYRQGQKQMQEMQNQMRQQFEQMMGGMGMQFPVFRQFGAVNSTLRGSITWDDKRWQFSDRKDLDRARLQLRRHLTSAKPNAKATPETKTKAAKSKPNAKATPETIAEPAADKGPAKTAKQHAPSKTANKNAPLKNWQGVTWHTNVAEACKQAAGGPGRKTISLRLFSACS